MVVSEFLRNHSSYVLDGYPRNAEQAEALGADIDLLLLINVDEEECIRRILERNQGREDDNYETAQKRYQAYQDVTQPMLKFYDCKVRMNTIDGCKKVEHIFKQICDIIDNISNKAK